MPLCSGKGNQILVKHRTVSLGWQLEYSLNTSISLLNIILIMISMRTLMLQNWMQQNYCFTGSAEKKELVDTTNTLRLHIVNELTD